MGLAAWVARKPSLPKDLSAGWEQEVPLYHVLWGEKNSLPDFFCCHIFFHLKCVGKALISSIWIVFCDILIYVKRVWGRQNTRFLHVLQTVKLSTVIQQPEKGRALQKEGWREKGRMTHWNRTQPKGCIQKPLDLGPVVQIGVTQISCLIPSAKPKSSWAFMYMKCIWMQFVFLAHFLQYQKKEDRERLPGRGGRSRAVEGNTTPLWYHHHYLTFPLPLFSVLSMTEPFACIGK